MEQNPATLQDQDLIILRPQASDTLCCIASIQGPVFFTTCNWQLGIVSESENDRTKASGTESHKRTLCQDGGRL